MLDIMHPAILSKRKEVIELCRRFGVTRLELFGSAARESDFNPDRSDFDFLVEFAEDSSNLAAFIRFGEALEELFGRRVDVVARSAIEKSPNYIRRRAILRDVESVYG
jgi:predicted nucleotidyltransferase